MEAIASHAAGDFQTLAAHFVQAGLRVHQPAPGILQVLPDSAMPVTRSVLISVGVHGDETAPIEMMGQVLAELAANPKSLTVNLLFVVGHPAAIAVGKRYLQVDLNRLFVRSPVAEANIESERAAVIMRASDDFFGLPVDSRWHLDLHTAIRASRYPMFAIIPDVFGAAGRAQMMEFLGAAKVQAAVMNRQLAGTFSAYSAINFGAISCTAELGQVGLLGENDLRPLAPTKAALLDLLQGRSVCAESAPLVFAVAQELIKHSSAFTLNFDEATENFTPLAVGSEIARDGELVYQVGAETEYIVFPNSRVAVGKRAGLLVVLQA